MDSDTPQALAGKVALITGANTGIGRVTARRLAQMGAQVFLACRSATQTQPVLDEIRALPGTGACEWLPLDLGDFDSVRACAQAFLQRGLPLHLLINNAGIAGAHGRTVSGFELAFGVNHMGHFLLTQLLQERLMASAPARIVTVASRAHRRVPEIDWDSLRQPTQTRLAVREYAQSKLANVLFSAELGRRLKDTGVTSYALHPGVIASDIWRFAPWPIGPLLRWRGGTTEQGALTTLYCASAAEVGSQTGLYYSACQVTATSAAGADMIAAANLWTRSEDWLR